MTTPPDPDTPLFDVAAPAALTPVERLLALADLYTQHNDAIDMLFAGRAPLPEDAYVSSSHRLERETLAGIKAVRQQSLPAVEPVTSAVVRLKQTAYLAGGATRYLTAARQARPADDAGPAHPDPRRGFGQYLRLARELTALAPATIVASAAQIAARLPQRARSTTTVPGLDAAQRGALLEVAQGHVAVTDQYGQRAYGHSVPVPVDVLRHLEAQGLVERQSTTVPPLFPGGPSRDRVRLTTLGTCVLSTVIDTPHIPSPPVASPVPAPATVSTARARR
ncbi:MULTISPECIES: hypothetical protein [Streptomyces]|uniref:Uncharacterized protein n=1 Tax=Streptomyces eurythermus TaxID=42237 RepID=A0ABW6Z7D2_9ACTN|nr:MULTISPECIES: hypothetical protein [Streptomyces]QIS75007.1 hypothetical protein HB370_37735 [Streptomyces sp. DSM 40868]